MAANQARKSAPTRLKMRSRAGMIYTAEARMLITASNMPGFATQQDLMLDTDATMMP